MAVAVSISRALYQSRNIVIHCCQMYELMAHDNIVPSNMVIVSLRPQTVASGAR